ncbi:MAG: glutathione S-transferase family protein [Panacagrimonas sp.]
MMTLHHCTSARSFRPLWTLEELGLGYELIVLPFPPRVLSREYLAVNSLGTIPAFRDGEVFMTESAAICQYLADRHPEGGLSVASTAPEYGDYLNGLHFGEATLTFPQTLVLRYGRFEPAERRQPQIVEDYTRWFLARLRRVEEILRTRPYLCGERFTVADISVGYALQLADSIGLAQHFPEGVAEYWTRLQTREAYRRALAAQENGARLNNVSTTPAPLAP